MPSFGILEPHHTSLDEDDGLTFKERMAKWREHKARRGYRGKKPDINELRRRGTVEGPTA